MIDTVFSISSLLTPFALGAAIGGIASERVPVGNAAGHLFSSWLNPSSILIGVVVASSTYLAAIYLAADAARLGEPELQRAFRARALGAGWWRERSRWSASSSFIPTLTGCTDSSSPAPRSSL